METRQRILAIRLMEALEKNPGYKRILGVQVVLKKMG